MYYKWIQQKLEICSLTPVMLLKFSLKKLLKFDVKSCGLLLCPPQGR